MENRKKNAREKRRMLDDKARSEAPGRFVTLSKGTVHYEVTGPDIGPAVVLVHGFSVPGYVWDATFFALGEAGFRCLRYDLYGRGYSDRPRTPYDHRLFQVQLSELLDALAISGPVVLAGVSMGGVISAGYAVRYTDRVRALMLIDPAAIEPRLSRAMRRRILPGVGELWMGLLGNRVCRQGLQEDLFRPEGFPDYFQRFETQLAFPGFKRALLSTLRCKMLENGLPIYHQAGQTGCPTLLIWGKEDRIIPFNGSKKVLEAIPHAQFFPIDNAGHLPHYEQADLVNPLLVDFLEGL